MRILQTHSDNLNFPYFYLLSFNEFVNKVEEKELLFFLDDLGSTLCCKRWKNKFLNFIQPVYPPLTHDSQRLTPNDEKIFLEKFIGYILQNNIADRIVQPENFAIFSAIPENSIYAKFATYYINLQQKTEDELFKNLHTKHRNVIRNAKKNEIVLKYGKQVLDDFYLLYQQTMKRSSMYCQPLSYFSNLHESLKQNCVCGVAYANAVPQGALFIAFTIFGAFYLYGASAEKIKVNGAINYLHWNTMMLLKEKGVKRYDFVGARLSDISGTRLEGIQQFKERFGSTLEQGYIWKKDLNIIKCNLYDGMLNVKLKLKNTNVPLDIIDQELDKIKNKK